MEVGDSPYIRTTRTAQDIFLRTLYVENKFFWLDIAGVACPRVV
jgi:hypothetical protein